MISSSISDAMLAWLKELRKGFPPENPIEESLHALCNVLAGRLGGASSIHLWFEHGPGILVVSRQEGDLSALEAIAREELQPSTRKSAPLKQPFHSAFLLSENHPAGATELSATYESITRRLKARGAVVIPICT